MAKLAMYLVDIYYLVFNVYCYNWVDYEYVDGRLLYLLYWMMVGLLYWMMVGLLYWMMNRKLN